MVTKKPKGLGRGLEALLGPSFASAGAAAEATPANPAGPAGQQTPTTLPLARLQPGMYQPRTRMDEGALYELAESIKAQGIMQPILVRRIDGHRGAPSAAAGASEGADGRLDGAGTGNGNGAVGAAGDLDAANGTARYEIIAGERRFRAARLAGLDEVPVLVRDVPDEAAAAMSLIENIQREDLNPLEEAQGLQRLVNEFGLTHETAAQAVGRSRSAASNLLRLLNLTEPVQGMLMAGDIDMGHARALLALDRAAQITAAHQIAARKLSVRETEALVKRLSAEFSLTPTPRRNAADKPRDLLRVEEELADLLAAEVEVRIRKRGRREAEQSGELVIHFGSLDALNGLIERIRRSA